MVAQTINQTLMEVEHTPAVHKKILDILPGVSGGVARVMVGQPFDTIKTRLQVMGAGTALAAKLPASDVYLNSNDCLRKMVSESGHLAERQHRLRRPRTLTAHLPALSPRDHRSRTRAGCRCTAA